MDSLRKIRIKKKPVQLLVLIVVFLILVFGSFYQVELEQVGIVLRFGKYVRSTDPGLRFKIPIIESYTKIPAQRQLKEEFGFRTEEAAVRSRYSQINYEDESSMLSGDLNVAMVEWIVQYRIADPYKYLFKVRNVTETFRDMNEAVVRAVVGDRTITEVLTVGRQEIETTVQLQLQELCDLYETGITIDQLVLQDVNPPDPVKPSWDEVNQAQQQKDRLINEAKAEYNQVIPRAEGEAQQTVLQAEGYGLDRVNSAKGEASRFKQLYEEYRRAPKVTRQRMYLETMQKILPKFGGKLYLDSDAKSVMPLLPLESLQGITGAAGRREGQ
ncbi:MAG: FtsH protease activity modulator HflK [Acidobacteria bacterium]|nr:FtsH protease activity modulator HflK [Acidobacteriota bacterium]